MLDPSARLLALLSLLQVRREWTGQELAERFEVDPRTIRRDVDKLRELGYPVHAARGVAGGYRLGSGARMPPLLLDDAEAVAVAVGLRTAAAASIAGIEETSISALAKLEQVLPDRLRRRVRALSAASSTVPLGTPSTDAEVLAVFAGACRDDQQVRFTYTAGGGAKSKRHVQPSALVHSGFNWYLAAFDLERTDWRVFRVDRVHGTVDLAGRGQRREVPGGDAAAFVQARAGRSGGIGAEPGRIQVQVSAATMAGRIAPGAAMVTPDGEKACLVATIGPWSITFLLWMTLLDHPMTILGPPDFVDAARAFVGRLGAALPDEGD